MKKQASSLSNRNDNDNDKYAKNSKFLGAFGFAFVKNVNGNECKAEMSKGVINNNLHCEGCFKKGFAIVKVYEVIKIHTRDIRN